MKSTNCTSTISHAFGMSYDIANEPQIMSQICNMNLEKISTYADIIASTNATDENFLKTACPLDIIDTLMPMLNDPNRMSDIFNPTSFGNMAYIAIHSPEPYKSVSLECLMLMMDAYNKHNVEFSNKIPSTNPNFCKCGCPVQQTTVEILNDKMQREQQPYEGYCIIF